MKIEDRPSEQQVATYVRILPMAKAAHAEMAELSKKKPDTPLNSLKIRHINRLLVELRTVLGSDPSIALLEVLDEETFTTNSDAVLILGQYLAALAQFHGKHYGWDGATRRWLTRERPGERDDDEDGGQLDDDVEEEDDSETEADDDESA